MANIQRGFESRRGEVLRSDAAGMQKFHVGIRTLVSGTGEVAFPLTFPVVFTELPAFSFGGELEQNTSPVTGDFPTVSAIVLRWVTEEKLPGIFYYKGCDVGAVVNGIDGNIWVHCNFFGKGFRNTIGTSGGVVI